MPRTIYLVIYSSRLFPAHWGLWIPSLHNPTIGKFLSAEGDAAHGFEIIFHRNYILDADATSRPHQCLPLAQVADCHVRDDVDGEDGREGADSTARDELERVLLGVRAPGKSLVGTEDGAKGEGQGLKKRVQIQNCQTWLRDGVAALVLNGIMDQEALRVVDGAPRN